MAWQIRNASLGGVEFYARETSEVFGRRVVLHEYPQRDVPYAEDIGRKARTFDIEALVIGPDYAARRDALIEVIERSGASQLVHPYYGTRVVTVVSSKVTHSSDHGGSARFSLSMVEAGELAEPAVDVDTAAQLQNVQTSARLQVQDEFLDGYSLDGLPSWGVGDIQSTLDSIVSLDSFSSVSDIAQAFRSNLMSLMLQPGELANGLFGLIGQLTDVSDLLSFPFMQTTKIAGVQSVGGKVRQQQSNVTVAVKRAALIQHAGLVTTRDLATVADVQAARAAVLQAFDEHDFARGNPRPSPALATTLRQVRTAALAQLGGLSISLPRTYETTLKEPLPALVLSYSVYGDLRQGEIVKRNAVRHPGFLPAGVPLQLTTNT